MNAPVPLAAPERETHEEPAPARHPGVVTSQPRITEITWEGVHSTLVLRRAAPGVIVITIKGTDVGEHGSGPFDALAEDIVKSPLVLFVDARRSRGVTTDVSSAWCKWLSRNRKALVSVHMLTGSAYVHVTANFVRNFAELADVMRIYSDAAPFEAALTAALSETDPPLCVGA